MVPYVHHPSIVASITRVIDFHPELVGDHFARMKRIDNLVRARD
jgi:hypothetical protein